MLLLQLTPEHTRNAETLAGPCVGRRRAYFELTLRNIKIHQIRSVRVTPWLPTQPREVFVPKKKLTDAKIQHLPRPSSGRVDYFDLTLPAFGIRVSSSGAASWFVFYRIDGKQIREIIGRYPGKDLALAREEAREKLRLVDRGLDPRQEEARRNALEARQRAETFGTIAQQYQTAKLSKRRAGDQMWRAIERDLMPHWRDTPIRQISRSAVMARLDAIETDAGPYARNRRAALLSAFFNFALDRELVDGNPAARVEKLDETARDRVLSDSELAEIWCAAAGLTQPLGPLVRMWILTGQRRTEISGLKWDEVSEKDHMAVVPAARMKGKLAHEIPLSPAAEAELAAVPRYEPAKTYVFASMRRKDAPVSGFGIVKRELDRLILEARREIDPNAEAMTAWRIHDIRRTVRSGLSMLGITRDVAERVIAHIPGGIQAVYDRHQYRDQKRQALNIWAAHVLGLVTPKPSNVAAIDEARQRAGGKQK